MKPGNNYKEIIKEWKNHPECSQLIENYEYLKANKYNVRVVVERIKEQLNLIMK